MKRVMKIDGKAECKPMPDVEHQLEQLRADNAAMRRFVRIIADASLPIFFGDTTIIVRRGEVLEARELLAKKKSDGKDTPAERGL